MKGRLLSVTVDDAPPAPGDTALAAARLAARLEAVVPRPPAYAHPSEAARLASSSLRTSSGSAPRTVAALLAEHAADLAAERRSVSPAPAPRRAAYRPSELAQRDPLFGASEAHLAAWLGLEPEGP